MKPEPPLLFSSGNNATSPDRARTTSECIDLECAISDEQHLGLETGTYSSATTENISTQEDLKASRPTDPPTNV
jgi:hypothetical protein